MAHKLLLSVSATQVSAARWRGRHFDACTVFTRDESGLAAFREYLTRVSNLPVYIMVDAVEEDYRFESLPHSFGPDRGEMVARKLRQHYRNTPYFSAQKLGRDESKRRDDRYLFCALTNAELIAPWVAAVLERGLPVCGVYLLPTLGQGLIEKVQVKAQNLLLLSVHSSGLRLTYFRDHKLRASRLARIDGGGAPGARGFADEISNTRLYLHALRVMTLDEHLTVMIVDRDDSLVNVAQTLAQEHPTLECRRLGRAEVASKLGIAQRTLDSSPDALYLHLLGLRAPDNNLAPDNVTAGYRRYRARKGLYAASGVAAGVGLLWCVANGYLIWTAYGEADDAQRQTQRVDADYQEATRQFPAAPASAENLRDAVELSQRISATFRTPAGAMEAVSRALDESPTVVLKTLSWKYGSGDLSDAARGGPALASPTGAARRESGLLEAEVRPFHGDYRAAIETINQFAAALSRQTQVAEVRVLQLPLNVNPASTLSGNTADTTQPQSGSAEFKLALVLKDPS